MQSKIDQAKRLCVALEQLLDATPVTDSVDPALIARTQVIVDHLALLAADADVRKNLRESVRGILNRWQRMNAQRAHALVELRLQLNSVEQGRQRLTTLARTHRQNAATSQLRATA